MFTASEDVAVSGIALVNDTDTEVDPRTASLVSGPAHGSPDPGCTRTVTMLVIVSRRRPLHRPTLPRRRIPHPLASHRPKVPRGLCRAQAAPRPEATGPTPPHRVRNARPTRCQPHPTHRRVASRRTPPRRPTRLPRRRPTPHTVAPSADPAPTQTPVLQHDSPTSEIAAATTELEPQASENSSKLDVLAGTTSIGSLTGKGELTDTQLFTSSGAADTAGSRLFATFNGEDNSALSTAQVTTPAATYPPTSTPH